MKLTLRVMALVLSLTFIEPANSGGLEKLGKALGACWSALVSLGPSRGKTKPNLPLIERTRGGNLVVSNPADGKSPHFAARLMDLLERGVLDSEVMELGEGHLTIALDKLDPELARRLLDALREYRERVEYDGMLDLKQVKGHPSSQCQKEFARLQAAEAPSFTQVMEFNRTAIWDGYVINWTAFWGLAESFGGNAGHNPRTGNPRVAVAIYLNSDGLIVGFGPHQYIEPPVHEIPGVVLLMLFQDVPTRTLLGQTVAIAELTAVEPELLPALGPPAFGDLDFELTYEHGKLNPVQRMVATRLLQFFRENP